jgi:hypothetical protein
MLYAHVTPLCYTSMPARWASKSAGPVSAERRSARRLGRWSTRLSGGISGAQFSVHER